MFFPPIPRWTYSTSEALSGSSYSGNVDTYNGGGFYVDLRPTPEETHAIINNLKKNRWVDRATRAIMIDFTIYNANINLFCVIKWEKNINLLYCNKINKQTDKLTERVTNEQVIGLLASILFGLMVTNLICSRWCELYLIRVYNGGF